MGFVPLLLPFVWVLELDSCGHPIPQTTELTGTMMVGKFNLETWLFIIAWLLAVILTPYFGVKIPTAGWRVVLHVFGLAAAGFVGYCALFLLFFTIFAEREVRGVGWLVVALFVGSFIDALLRFVWSIQEWRAAKRALKETPG